MCSVYFREPWRKREHNVSEEETTPIQWWGNQMALNFPATLESMIPVKNAFKILLENDVQPQILYYNN